MRYAILLLPLCVGCIPAGPGSTTSFVPALSVLCGVAATTGGESPAPEPSDECETCGGQGWLGDGTIKQDCPDCETPWRQTPPEAAPVEEVHSATTSGGQSLVDPAATLRAIEDAMPTYSPLFFDSYADGKDAADARDGTHLLLLYTKPDMDLSGLLRKCEAADGLPVIELYADGQNNSGETNREAMTNFDWPGAVLYRATGPIAIPLPLLCRRLTEELTDARP